MKRNDSLEVAVIQASTPLFDSAAAVDKACRLIVEAGASGARLVVLPEAFIGGYPRGLSFGTVVGSRSREGRELCAGREARRTPPEAEAHRLRAPGLGGGRRLGPDGARDAIRPDRRPHLLGKLHAARPRRAPAAGRHHPPRTHGGRPARMAVDHGAHRARESRLRARVQPGHHQAGLPGRASRPPRDRRPPGRPLPRRQRRRLAPRRAARRTSLGGGAHPAGEARSARDGPGPLRLRSRRPLCAPGRLPLRRPRCPGAGARRCADRRGVRGA